MQDVVTFWGQMFTVVCDFLMSEPINYFTGILLLIAIFAFVKSLF